MARQQRHHARQLAVVDHRLQPGVEPFQAFGRQTHFRRVDGFEDCGGGCAASALGDDRLDGERRDEQCEGDESRGERSETPGSG